MLFMKPNPCHWLMGIAIAVLASMGPGHCADRPNVMFILAEDQGAQAGYLGTPGLQTPSIDGLARSGIYFTNAMVAYPVCSASKAALYTGLHNHTNGILNNTYNYHKPAEQVTPQERRRPLFRLNRIRDPYVTLTQILHDSGYFQGVSHKLHVLPNEKFPYDQFLHGGREEIHRFIETADQSGRPWFLMVNVPHSHRPYPNSDKQAIRVDPSKVQPPSFLPESEIIRKDWSEYLAAIEQTDHAVGQALDVLQQTDHADDTLVVYLSDHGPTYQHGKMTLYDLGLRVPLIFRGPDVVRGQCSDALVSEVDLLPTLLEYCEIDHTFDVPIHGRSIAGVVRGETASTGREYIYAEISDRGPLPNDGMQERMIFDGRMKLIYRENVETGWRQVNADSREFPKWGNRVYDETIRLKDRFPVAYRILAEMDPQNLGGSVPELELYDLSTDPDELRNRIDAPEYQDDRERLLRELTQWCRQTKDVSVTLGQTQP
ncbi:Arylsulfatase [Crateriforma conspicua]|uniref:Arylsulfatase n=2 Tax=Crateriforma conspicua TaxID=2527996 RepID=A0A5C6FJD9_9PLAN|nr:Arylsulfatase [Crateriforma conspicua]